MPKHAKSTFEVKSWDENTLSEVDQGQAKITRASVAFTYKGDVEGESAMEYLMVYGADGSATVIGIERITGKLEGKAGSFVLEHHGGYADGVAKAEFTIVDGSGTGALGGISGSGTAIARKDGSTEFGMRYELPSP
jgi:Protein of unknown function (DUF3224)